MQNIVSYFSDSEFNDSSDLFFGNRSVTYSGAGNSSSKALVVSNVLRLAASNGAKVGDILWVVDNATEMEKIRKTASIWGSRPVHGFKALEEEDRSEFSTTSEFEREKSVRFTEFMSRIIEGDAFFVIPFSAVFKKFPSSRELIEKRFKLKVGEEMDVVAFIEKLVDVGHDNTDDEYLKKGQYYKVGDSVVLWPVNTDEVYRVEFNFEKVESICRYDAEKKKDNGSRKGVMIYPVEYEEEMDGVIDAFDKDSIVIDDELDITDDFYDAWNSFMKEAGTKTRTVSFTSFNEDESNHRHLHFYSVLKYRTGYDFANDLRDKIHGGWKVLVFTKSSDEVGALLDDQKVPYKGELPSGGFESAELKKGENGDTVGSVYLVDVDKEDIFPQAFQAPDNKILLVTDIEISLLREKVVTVGSRKVFEDFLSGLKSGDYVVHSDHGIARFQGLDRKTVDDITREYLKLGYAENDKLFVPIDQADKVSKYIGSQELMPKLTRLGSAEWSTITSKVRKETQKIAKELLALYAARKTAQGFAYKKDIESQDKFEETFPYEETPGQLKAINDVKGDMESSEPMDRLVCGDVGFGKTEVAMRAAFKAVQDKKQVALISPITILTDQHYRSFKKRMEPFHIRVEMLSRFKSVKEQKATLDRLAKGEADVVIGTHRLLQPDIKFKNLGLVVVDEEQRFGVKQKEKLKELRAEVDILTLTATPIPRTLNICLNKLRDITTITTPPPGRLPVITEVRKFSPGLVRDAILREVERGGQVYFLHNRVQTINSMADKLRELIPEASFGVAHGKLGSGDLEERIISFKEGRFDVLVSSTIIENGIDLANANTLIVNNAEKFGLAQLYQLRGRVGRSKTQAYAYFLYHGQRLHLDAKKRLRAIVEASDLGSGFQIAMKDLEIRGAGDILGANQHGVINVVGVPHFMRMLNKAVADLKAGRIAAPGGGEEPEVTIELPIPAYIPDDYIVNARDKIGTYQKLAGADDLAYLEEVREEMLADFGKLPREVANLFRIIELKVLAKKAGVTNIRSESVRGGADKEIVLTMGPRLTPAHIVSLLEYNSAWNVGGTKLRIGITDLGMQWFEELKACVEKLSVKAKHGGR
jgi:transcription-repair coupling factor